MQKLGDAMCYMIENDEERHKYAAQAITDSECYSVETIMQKWIALFDAVM